MAAIRSGATCDAAELRSMLDTNGAILLSKLNQNACPSRCHLRDHPPRLVVPADLHHCCHELRLVRVGGANNGIDVGLKLDAVSDGHLTQRADTELAGLNAQEGDRKTAFLHLSPNS